MTTNRRETLLVLAAIAAAAVLTACSAKKTDEARESQREPAAEMTERSATARSPTRAPRCGAAMERDSAAARAREDAQSQ